MMSTLTTQSHDSKYSALNASALFFEERKDFLDTLDQSENQAEARKTAIDHWRNEALLLDDNHYQARLNALGLNEEEFGNLLLLSLNTKALSTDNSVAKEQVRIGLKEWEEALLLNRSIPLQSGAPTKLISAFRPFLLWAARQWDTFVDECTEVRLIAEVDRLREKLLQDLAECLLQFGARTFVLELHVAKQMGELYGDTPEERFRSFVERKLWDTAQIEFLYNEYPILARMLMIRTIFIVNATLEAMERFTADRPKLILTLGLPQDCGRLQSFVAGMGDAHQEGRSVIRMQLEDGTELVYKPKPLGASKHFSDFLGWMNSQGFHPEFKPMRVLDQGNYGWEEFIVQRGCTNSNEVERYYTRLGGLLAILYSMRGTDFHMENVIASGEHPIPIDLETVFHNTPTLHFPDTADVEAKKKIVDSVIGTGLLPLLLYQNEEGFGVEMSGIGGGEQVLPFPVLQVENDETDEMRFVRKAKSTKGSENIPMLNNIPTHAAKYVNHIVEGFRQACSIFRRNRTLLLDKNNSPLAPFANDTVRIILRATQFYANFLMESGHPNYTRDAFKRELLMDRLWFTVLDPRAIASERQDLLYGDIPYFTTTPSSLDLYDSRGQRIPGFFASSSYDLALKRLLSLDDEEDRQVDWIISSILGSADWRSTEKGCCNKNNMLVNLEETGESDDQAVESIDQNNTFLEQASEIGDYLLKEAIYSTGGHDATWVGVGMNYRGQWNVAAMKGGLYDGAAGPSLFLAHLGRLTGQRKYSDLAQLSMRTSIASLPYNTSFGSAFYGQASVLYSMLQLSALGLNEKNWSEKTALILNHLRMGVPFDNYYDVLGGGAGIIPVLLDLYREQGIEEALDTAILYGDRLLEYAIPLGDGLGWPSPLKNKQPLGGFAHGSAGIAWSLNRLARINGDPRYLEAAEAALRYDRSLYNSEKENWTDLRKLEASEAHSSKFWCHGSAGIGLSRLLLLQDSESLNGCTAMLDEIETAIHSSLNGGIGASHCLCHGDMGIQELLLQSGLILGRQEDLKKARLLAQHVIREKKLTGHWQTGVPRAIATPGFFLGYSGIGYQLLRTVDPTGVPSVLSLAQPALS
ncbi:type 2 lanthipeptide synthetase LanM family protein [Paenibacillus pabuli]|uniref:Type 2 lantibiotic biosynthesis protein LanM n=2 Tax=Paenibacillus TaxID=44249 RepID=A0A855YCL7_9BACL|nr:type 2 lanthipeptide synthetase LanM family protein [Paenibacillus pabuli]PWW42198.1 type 2 lantibiotic biosynthesis protein LanM [Paenibacillus pabuli]PXW07586.1 type 2 lantibiotic biosynthesis protein LanM [Paenibacillus taichungensis]